jgi:hypothetical protein
MSKWKVRPIKIKIKTKISDTSQTESIYATTKKKQTYIQFYAFPLHGFDMLGARIQLRLFRG